MKPKPKAPENARKSRVGDDSFQAAVEKLFREKAGAFEALARSEREDATMSPEELALKYPNRR